MSSTGTTLSFEIALQLQGFHLTYQIAHVHGLMNGLLAPHFVGGAVSSTLCVVALEEDAICIPFGLAVL